MSFFIGVYFIRKKQRLVLKPIWLFVSKRLSAFLVHAYIQQGVINRCGIDLIKKTENIFCYKTPLLLIKTSGQSNFKQFNTYLYSAYYSSQTHLILFLTTFSDTLTSFMQDLGGGARIYLFQGGLFQKAVSYLEG